MASFFKGGSAGQPRSLAKTAAVAAGVAATGVTVHHVYKATRPDCLASGTKP